MSGRRYLDARILIVDDQPLNVRVLERLLRDAGYSAISSTTDPREVLALCAESDPDLVLLDLHMPVLNGFEVMGRLEMLLREPNCLPVLVLTADDSPDTKRRALLSGAKDFLPKSFDTEEALQRIRNLIEARFLQLELQRQNLELESRVMERTLLLEETNYRLEKAVAKLQRTQARKIEEERLRAIGQMASGIAHDLNNTLAPIVGFADLLLSRPEVLKDSAKLDRYLTLIRTAASDAGRVVGRLKEFYRRSSAAPALEAADLNGIARESVALVESRWRDPARSEPAMIRIEIDLAAVSPVAANPGDMRHVLVNLLLNAVDAMPSGGTLRVRTVETGQTVDLEVTDTGMGMTEEVRQRCLDPFFTTKGDAGTGMGLAEVQAILRRHGAPLRIRSRPGSGTTFSIRLPLWTGSAAPPASDLQERTLDPHRLLVVEDDPVIRELLCDFLQADGHWVEAAANGRDGLAAYRPGAFDLVLTDHSMPDMTGAELGRAIKERCPEQRLIMLTGFGGFMDEADRLPEFEAVLGKPLRLGELRAAIDAGPVG